MMNPQPFLETPPDFLPFLRLPQSKFEIRDEHGRLQAVIASWKTTKGVPLMASFVPCHCEDDPSKQSWQFAQSTCRLAPFGIETAMAYPDATVIIDDSLHIVQHANGELRKHLSPPSIVLVGWPKGMQETKPSDIDWSALKGRKVVCAVSNDAESFEDGLVLGQELDAVGTICVEFALPCRTGDCETAVVHTKTGELRAERVSWPIFQEIAEERFGLTSERETSPVKSRGWKLCDPMPNGSINLEYFLNPIIPKGSVSLLYSAPGVGKSWLALLIAYAIGGGTGILGGRWKARSRRKCLFISTEMTGQVISRLDMIHRSLGCQEAEDNITIYPHPDRPHRDINLEEEEAWLEINGLIDNADFVVIDHLSNVTSGNIDTRSWRRLWHFIDRIKRSGKSILILHHAGKNGAQRGTSVLEADVDAIIRMERIPGVKNGAQISFDKDRDDDSFGRLFTPFNLFWTQGDEPNTCRWWVEDTEDSKDERYVSIAQGHRPFQIDDGALNSRFSDRQAIIVRLLAEAAIRGEAGLSSGTIAKGIDASSGTVRRELEGPIENGVVTRSGRGRATRYAISEQTLRDITNK